MPKNEEGNSYLNIWKCRCNIYQDKLACFEDASTNSVTIEETKDDDQGHENYYNGSGQRKRTLKIAQG